AVAAWALASASAFAEDKIIVGLITKEYTNPFFVKMKEGAEAKAKELGVDFRSLAGKSDGDNTGQVDAIERLMNVGAKAILITPSDTKAIVPSIERARKAGILVIALDTPLDPPRRADRQAHRRPSVGPGRGTRRPRRDGDAAPEGSEHQCRLHDQRADGGRRLCGAQGRGQGQGRAHRLRRRRVSGREEHRRRRHRRHRPAI